jgi:LacI family transcriptional regulator
MTARKTSIRDVAAAAGVSVTTVSQVLNEVGGARIAEDTRVRVRQASEALGYIPSRLARGLRTQRTNIIGLLSDHIATTPHAGKIILGAQEAALGRGWILLIFNTGGDAGVEQREAAAMLQHEVEGVLYASMYHRVVELPAALAGVPTVLLDARTADQTVPAVVPDEVAGGRTAVTELLRCGHSRIGFVTNRDDIPATHGRLQGYRAALHSAGTTFNPRLVAVAESESGGGYLAARALLSLSERPTALFCLPGRRRARARHPRRPVRGRLRQPGNYRGRTVSGPDDGGPPALRDGAVGGADPHPPDRNPPLQRPDQSRPASHGVPAGATRVCRPTAWLGMSLGAMKGTSCCD